MGKELQVSEKQGEKREREKKDWLQGIWCIFHTHMYLKNTLPKNISFNSSIEEKPQNSLIHVTFKGMVRKIISYLQE